MEALCTYVIPGWETIKQEPPLPLYTYNKDFAFCGDTVDVLVFIFASTEKYRVESSVEARSSGPYNYVDGEVATLREAFSLVEQICMRHEKRFMT